MTRHCFRLRGLFSAVILALSAAAAAQTSRPIVASEPAGAGAPAVGEAKTKPYDLWTTKELTGDWGGVRTALEDIGIKWELSYQQQFQSNWLGGADTHNGHRFSGSYDLVGKIDFGKMKLIPDGGFYIKAKGGYGKGINSKVGASSYATPNSDAYDDAAIYLDKWYYSQKLWDDKIEFLLGVIETVKDLYDVSLYANHEDKDFLNRLSFRNATIPHKTGMGANVKVTPVKWFYVQAGTFDAQGKKEHTQFDTAFHDEAWYVGLWELGFTLAWSSPKGPMPGRYRVGMWYDPTTRAIYEDLLDGAKRQRYQSGEVGYYFGLDQMIWKENDNAKDEQGLGFFTRYGHAHGEVHSVNHYWSAGVSYKGLVPTRNKDVAGFGVSQAIYSDQYRNARNALADRETVYEWFYNIQLTPWCVLTPDLQVITNPGGNKDSRDAVVGGLRIRVLF